MSRTKKIAVLAIIAMVLTMLPVQLFAADTAGTSSRIFGASRVETALEVCKTGWTSANTVVVAPADQANLVDALAAAPLAGQENAPILLTFKDSLDAAVKAKIAALGAKKVYVVGAISDSVKNEIAGISGVTVEALKGSNRWDTAKAINAKLTSPAGSFVVGYNALADALSVSAFAAANKYAIILADVNGNIPVAQSALGSKTYIVGGQTLVSDIAGATRLAGADRFATNKVILETLTFNYNTVYVANGFNDHLVDSLVAAPLAAKTGAPIVLAGDTGVGAAADYVNGKLTATSNVVALGGTGVVSDAVRDNIKYNTPATFAVSDITPVSLNSFKVTFNQTIDEDTAENVANYKVDGNALSGANPKDVAIMQSDNKSVLIILDSTQAAAYKQNQVITVEVTSNRIYNEKKTSAAGSFTKNITLVDTAVPQIAGLSVTGNKKLTLTFDEPVKVPALGDVQNWQIDGTNLSSLGLVRVNMPAAETTTTGVGAQDMGVKVEMYFGTSIASGSHTFKVKKGALAGQLSDLGNYVFAESTKDFTVEAMTGNPKVSEVVVENNTIYVLFDRAMAQDSQGNDNTNPDSALNVGNYNLNDKGYGTAAGPSLGANPVFKANTGSKKVELTAAAGVVQKGINVIEIDKDLKDAWGNKLSDGSTNIRVSFNYAADETKPTVLSVSALSSTKVRINFSEKINAAYAANANNYELKKSDGTPATPGVDFAVATVPAATNSDTVEITTLTGGWKLTGTGYTLKVKNLPDIATTPNIMDTYTTTFDGIDDIGPNLTEVINNTNTHKAVAFFSEKMDSATIIVDNFGYVDGAGEAKNLPTGSTVSLDGTGKIVTITFPDAYTVNAGGAGGTNDKYEVVSVRASNVKDTAGNLIQGVAQTMAIIASAAATQLPTFVTDSFNLYDNGDGVKAEFQMSQEITSLVVSDFIIGKPGIGLTADSGYTEGKKVVLNYTSAWKVDTIRFAGPNAWLDSVAFPQSTNTAGVTFAAFPGNGYQVYDEQIQPRIVDYTFTSAGADDKILVTFSEPVDLTIAGLYDDDFVMTDAGGATSVTVPAPVVYTDADGTIYSADGVATTNGYVVLFDIANAAYASGITIKAEESKISIRDMKDRGPENYNTLKLTSDQKTGITETADTTAIALSAWYADKNQDGAAKNIVVDFSEPLDATAAELTVANTFDIQAASGAPAAGNFTAAGLVKTIVAPDKVMITAIGETDANLITAASFLGIVAGAVQDLAQDNAAGGTAIAATNGIAPTVFVADATPYRLISITNTAAAVATVVVSDYLATADYAAAGSWTLTGNAALGGGATPAKGANDFTVVFTYAGVNVIAAGDTITIPATDGGGAAKVTAADRGTATAAGAGPAWTID